MQQQTTRRNDTPLVKGGDYTSAESMMDTAFLVGAFAVIALVIAAFIASYVTLGWAAGTLITAAGFALYCVGKSDGREQA